jgi:glycosyltransferase involved in cell wall biosynthesis
MGRTLGKGVVLTVHGRSPRPHGFRGLLFDFTERTSLAWPHVLVFVASSLRETLGAGGVVIPNGVDASSIQSRVAALHRLRVSEGQDCTFLFLGRVSVDKGFLVLLQAYAAVRSRVQTPTSLVVVGPIDDDVATAIRKGDQSLDGVEIAGPSDSPTDWLAAADVFVLPSFNEGLPLSLLEAMAAGLPAVVTMIGDMPTVVRSGETGWLVHPGDARELESAMAEAASSGERREEMGRRGKLLIASKFDLEECVKAYETTYARAIRKAAGQVRGGNA